MANPELSTYKFTFRRLVPGEVCGLLLHQAQNPSSRLTLRWKDEKTETIVVSATVSPHLWERNQGIPLKELYHLIRTSHEVVVEEVVPVIKRKSTK